MEYQVEFKPMSTIYTVGIVEEKEDIN